MHPYGIHMCREGMDIQPLCLESSWGLSKIAIRRITGQAQRPDPCFLSRMHMHAMNQDVNLPVGLAARATRCHVPRGSLVANAVHAISPFLHILRTGL